MALKRAALSAIRVAIYWAGACRLKPLAARGLQSLLLEPALCCESLQMKCLITPRWGDERTGRELSLRGIGMGKAGLKRENVCLCVRVRVHVCVCQVVIPCAHFLFRHLLAKQRMVMSLCLTILHVRQGNLKVYIFEMDWRMSLDIGKNCFRSCFCLYIPLQEDRILKVQ